MSYWPISDRVSPNLLEGIQSADRHQLGVVGAMRLAQLSQCKGKCASVSARTWGAFGVFGT